MADELELTVLPFLFGSDTKQYANYLDWREIEVSEFYDTLRQGGSFKTSAVNVNAFVSAMEPVLANGEDILYIGFSSALSSAYNSSAMAVKELEEKYPERKIFIVDSLSASLGQGLLLYHAVREKRKGKSIEEVRDYVENTKLKVCHWFTVDDLMFLKRGGRVSAASAVMGTVLNIKPIMHTDNSGRLTVMGKVRGRKASLKALVTKMQELGTNLAEQKIFICHGDCRTEAESVAEWMRTLCGIRDILIHPIGPVIGAHTGPNTIGIFFLGTER